MPTVKKPIKPIKLSSKAAVKPTVKPVVKAVKTADPEETNTLTVSVYDFAGKKVGTQKLPEASFALKNNNQLLSQAVRVYETNISTHNANTQTRGEVRGGGAKPWKQKGTGNARAGSRRSPLWVGGGITHGPRSRNVKLSLPQKMKRIALLTALSKKSKEGSIHIISDLEKIKPKTQIVASLLKTLNLKGKTLLIISTKNENINLASRNIQNLNVDVVTNLNAHEVLRAANLLFSKESIGVFK